MSNKHLIKVLVSFSVVIVLGLISLVFIDSLKHDEVLIKETSIVNTSANTSSVKKSGSVTLPPVKAFNKTTTH